MVGSAVLRTSRTLTSVRCRLVDRQSSGQLLWGTVHTPHSHLKEGAGSAQVWRPPLLCNSQQEPHPHYKSPPTQNFQLGWSWGWTRGDGLLQGCTPLCPRIIMYHIKCHVMSCHVMPYVMSSVMSLHMCHVMSNVSCHVVWLVSYNVMCHDPCHIMCHGMTHVTWHISWREVTSWRHDLTSWDDVMMWGNVVTWREVSLSLKFGIYPIATHKLRYQPNITPSQLLCPMCR